MNKLKNLNDATVKTTSYTRNDCLQMAKEIKVGEPEGSIISPQGVILLNLFRDMLLNVRAHHNLYSGFLVEGHLLYPFTGVLHPSIDEKTGMFHVDPQAGLLNIKLPNREAHYITGDIHSNIPEFFTGSAHLHFHLLHNLFIFEGEATGFEEAKKLTMACFARVIMDLYKQVFGAKYDKDIINAAEDYVGKEKANDTIVNTKEVAYGFMQWSDFIMPSVIDGINLYQNDITIIKKFKWNETFNDKKIELSDRPLISQAMSEKRVTHMLKYASTGMATWESTQKEILGEEEVKEDGDVPILLGMLNETDRGRPGILTSLILSSVLKQSIIDHDLLDIEIPLDIVTGHDVMNAI